MRKWTEISAVKALTGNVLVGATNKQIHAPNGLNGLKQCSAVDFLVNHCGYLYIK
jgi:hypothetical protein